MLTKLLERISETREIYQKISSDAPNGVYLYGAGFVGRWSVAYLEGIGIPVLGFVDSDSSKWGASILGKPVFSPSDPLIVSARSLLITSRHAVPAIKNALAHLSAFIMSIDAFVVHQQGKEGIERVEQLLSDDRVSLNTFHAVLLSMLEGTTRPLKHYANNRPFFDQFGFFNRDGEVFVDAGAYVGDSLERFIWSVNGVFRHAYAFEPGKTQYEAMEKRVNRLASEWALRPESITLINKAVASENGMVRIIEEGQLTSHSICLQGTECVLEDKTEYVDVVSLDSYLSGVKYSLLKVDVEGSELDLIHGAKESISENRPRIALSIYHYPTDVFTLPLKVAEISGDYTFTLGHHSSKLMETVLYCRDIND